MPDTLAARPLYGGTLPLLRRAVGARVDRFDAPVRRMHEVRTATVALGRTNIDRGRHPVARLVGWVFGFPPAGRRLATAITVLAGGGAEIWHRRFAGHPILTRLEPASRPRTIVERFRFNVTFDLEVLERVGALHFELRGMRVCGVPMPRVVWPLLRAQECARGGGFSFDIGIGLRCVGPLIRYSGFVRPQRLP